MDASLPDRTKHWSHHGAGPLNANLGTGHQTNNTINGGSNNQQFIGPTTVHQAPQETPPQPLSTVPFTRDDGFVKREEFNALDQKLSRGGRRVAITGLGGIGKSQLAIEYCHHLRQKSSSAWVLWLHASSAARFDQDIRTLADDVKIPGRKEKDANVYQLVRAWLLEPDRKWLVVLDSADDAEFLFQAPSTADVDSSTRPRMDYVPACAHGSTLITTRFRKIARRLADKADIIELQPDRTHAIALLQSKLGRETDLQTVESLAAALEHMPLAVVQAAAYIDMRAPHCSPKDYLALFMNSDEVKIEMLSEAPEQSRRDIQEASNSILVSWQISFEHIRQSRTSAADLLSLASFYDCQSIPRSLLTLDPQPDIDSQPHDKSSAREKSRRSTFKSLFGRSTRQQKSQQADARTGVDSHTSTSEDMVSKDLQILADYCLISAASSQHTVKMHRLVQLSMQMWLTERTEHQHWEGQSLRSLDAAFPQPDYERWEECRALYPHARLLLSKKLQGRDATLDLASIGFKAAMFAWTQGSYAEAEVAARQSLALRASTLGEIDKDTLDSLDMLALVLADQGKYRYAEEMSQRALEGRQKVLGPLHRSTLTSVINLAQVLADQGNYGAAEEMNQRALESCEKVLGTLNPCTMMSISNLASVLLAQGKYEAAEAMNRRALDGREKVLGPEHPETLTSVNNHALILRDQGKYEAAEEMNRRALEGEEKVLGPLHPDTLTSVNNLALVLADQHQYEAAEEMNRRALEGREKVLGPEHPSTLMSVNNHALILAWQGKYEAAEEMSRRALEGREKELGREHPDTLTSVDSLAAVLLAQGKYEVAEEMFRRALEGREKVLGREHPTTLASVDNLAVVAAAPGQV